MMVSQGRRMRSAFGLAYRCAGAALGITLILGAAGCAALPQSTATSSEATEDIVLQAASSAGVAREDVAIVVDGKVFTQQDVDRFVKQARAIWGFSDDASYSAYLDGAGRTDWDVRKEIMAALIRNALIQSDAARHDIAIDDAAVQSYIDRLEERYPSRSAWLQALSNSGYTEESYKATVRIDLLSRALKGTVVPEPELSQDQIQQYAVVVAPTLAGRRSSHILFSNNDFETALEVYQKLRDGADFAEMAREYSIDGTGASGGDVGWDSVGNFVSDYEDALDKLSPGEMSPIIKSQFGYHIILCTEQYEPTYLPDGSIDLDAIPDDLMDIITSSMCENLTDQMYDTYLSNLEASSTLAVFDEKGTQVDPTELGLSDEVRPLESSEEADAMISQAGAEGNLVDPSVGTDVDSVVSATKGAASLAE